MLIYTVIIKGTSVLECRKNTKVVILRTYNDCGTAENDDISSCTRVSRTIFVAWWWSLLQLNCQCEWSNVLQCIRYGWYYVQVETKLTFGSSSAIKSPPLLLHNLFQGFYIFLNISLAIEKYALFVECQEADKMSIELVYVLYIDRKLQALNEY